MTRESAVVTELRRQLEHGTATVEWVRTIAIPNLQRLIAGGRVAAERLLGRSLIDQGIVLTTDEDPSLEGG